MARFEHAPQNARTEQSGGWLLHHHHPVQGIPQLAVGVGLAGESREIPAEEIGTARLGAGSFRELEISADCHQPRDVDHLLGPLEEAQLGWPTARDTRGPLVLGRNPVALIDYVQ